MRDREDSAQGQDGQQASAHPRDSSASVHVQTDLAGEESSRQKREVQLHPLQVQNFEAGEDEQAEVKSAESARAVDETFPAAEINA